MEDTAKKAVATKEEPKSKYKYVGPAYTKGLLCPDGSRIKPLDMSDQEIEAAIAKFPALKEYFSV